MGPGLITQNVVNIKSSDIGACQIELCVGDITKLHYKDKVDVLVVSAIPGDYSPTPSSLIGQLQIKLGISVRNLSKDKEEDLRNSYYCWWSKPLPDHLSYGRVMCFEGASSPPKTISAIFRCLVPVLKNKEGSVIMPLVTTGDQGYSKELVLKQTLKAAVNWIKAGLPLKTLKIVDFSTNPEKESKSFEPLFERCKKYLMESIEPEVENIMTEVTFDLDSTFISHCPKDHSTAVKLKGHLEERGFKVYNDIQEVNDQEPWQDGIYRIMAKCSSIVVLMSQGYLASESCLEQYNMALCISRKGYQKVFAFLLFQSGPTTQLPTYSGQMIIRENDETHLKEIADTICEQIPMACSTRHQYNTQAFIEERRLATNELGASLANNLDIHHGVPIAEEKGSQQETEYKEERVELVRDSRGIGNENQGKVPCEQDEMSE